MALEARGFTRPGRRTLLWSPPDSGRRSVAALGTGGGARGPDRGARRRVLGMSLVLERGRVPLCRRDAAVAARRRPRARPRRGGWTRRRLARRERRRSAWWPADSRRGRSAGQIRGRISIDGQDIDGWPMHELSRRVGDRLPEPDDAAVAGRRHRLRRGRLRTDEPRPAARGGHRAHVGGTRRRCSIDELAERDPRRLSGGQQQLVAMAGLLAMRPEHLVLDEPTAQLDPAGTRLVADAIAGLAADGASHPGRRAEDRSPGGGRVARRRPRPTVAWRCAGRRSRCSPTPSCRSSAWPSPPPCGCAGRGRAAGVSMERLERALDG